MVIGDLLKSRGILPWMDMEQLRPGVPWQRVLESQIKKIRSAAVFVGDSGPGPYQNFEIEAFLRKFVEKGSPVIPVFLGEKQSQAASRSPLRIRRLPLFLQSFQYVDFRRTNPDPLTQLVWGITGKRGGA